MTAYELYREGNLGAAIEAALRGVKAAPTDLDARLLLCDLLCFDQQLERADRQLELLVQQDPGLGPPLALYRQLIRAEVARQEVFQSGRVPELLDEVTDVVSLHLRAAIAVREGATQEAAELLRQAEEQRRRVAGECDGVPFGDLRDLNDLTAPFLEVLTITGKYYWIAWDRLERLEFKPPKFLRDVLWRQAEMVIPGKPEAMVYVPVLYAGSHGSPDQSIRLGRRTEWQEQTGGYTAGAGQRTLLVGDEGIPLLSVGRITFSRSGDGTTSGSDSR
jgi:type VI secretion system protein ImpE